MRLARVILAAVVLSLCASVTTFAQTVAGAQLSGVVKDASGGVLPGVTVTVTKTNTNAVRTTVTGSDGAYTFPNLPIGPYRLKAELSGFSTYVQDGIVLQVNSNPTIDVTLKVGAQTEEITVHANAAMIETHATGVGQVIDTQRVEEMPLNGRQATELIFLSGLATSAPSGDLNTNKNFPTVTISVAGGQANGMTYIMDGSTHNDPFNNLNLPTPMPDALQEFKVETSALPARYGQHAASAVNLVTKSGSNVLHGSGFEFLRNNAFNAKNYFATAKDTLRRNQFGGTLGGPVKKNKAFFFGAYQGTIEKSEPATTFGFVPTAAMLAGDFTTFASTACQTKNITLPASMGFAGNTIAPSKFSPITLAFLKHVPVATDPCGKVSYGIPNNSTEHQALGKLDYTINGNQSAFVRYMFAQYDNPATYDGKNVLTLSRTSQTNTVHALATGHNWTISEHLVNSLHVTYNRTLNDRPLPAYFSAADLGASVYSPVPGYVGISVNGSGFSVGAGGTNPGFFNSRSFQIADDVDWIRGAHQFAVGVNWIRTDIDTVNNRPTNGAFTFNGSITGISMVDFMMGRVGNFLQGNAVYDNDRNDYIGAYIQDNWKVRDNVTINYGVRWEPYLPIKNKNGYVSSFDMARFVAGTRSTVYPQAPAGLYFKGDPGFPGDATSFARLNEWAPRVGVIWSPDSKTSVRASYGMFYDSAHLFFNTRFANNPPWGAQITLTNPAGGFADPYLNYPGGNPFPALQTGWATQAFPTAGVYVNTPTDVRPTVLHQWNVSLQRQVGDWMVSASYLGNHSSHLWRATELNPAVYAPGATTGTTNARRVLNKLNPAQGAFYGTLGQLDDTGRANYNAMLLTLQRRLKSNLSVLSNYTLSKCMADPATTELTGPTITNPNNPGLDYSYCASDRRHVVNVSLVYTSPTFEGRTVLNALFGAWQVAPIVRYQSGNRSSVTTGADNALSGMGGQRAVQVLDNPYGAGGEKAYLNVAAFASPAAGTYSTLAPFAIVNPASFQNDLAITRNFRMNDRTLQFRWEIFNVTNHVNFGAPVTALNNSNFGKILTAGSPRMMQFALKFSF